MAADVCGQLVGRRKASRGLMFIDLQDVVVPGTGSAAGPGCGSSGGASQPSAPAQRLQEVELRAGSSAGGLVGGAAAFAALRQGEGRLRLGDYVRCTGRWRAVAAAAAAPHVGGMILVAETLEVVERFSQRHPPGTCFDLVTAAPWRLRRASREEPGQIAHADTTTVRGRRPRAAAAPAPVDGVVSGQRFCKFWLNSGRCTRPDCPFSHGRDDAAAAGANHAPPRAEIRRAHDEAARAARETRAAEAAAAAAAAGTAGHTPAVGAGVRRVRLQSKSRRAAVCADWLLAHYGRERLSRGSGVVDVAGGRGALAFELCARRGIPCTVLDPRLADGVTGRRYTRAHQRWVRAEVAAGRTPRLPALCAALLEPALWQEEQEQEEQEQEQQQEQQEGGGTSDAAGSVAATMASAHHPDDASSSAAAAAASALLGPPPRRRRHAVHAAPPPALGGPQRRQLRQLLRSASLLVGIHPDQATESIVDCALALRKPWAVVPCCVFAYTFVHRRLHAQPLPLPLPLPQHAAATERPAQHQAAAGAVQAPTPAPMAGVGTVTDPGDQARQEQRQHEQGQEEGEEGEEEEHEGEEGEEEEHEGEEGLGHLAMAARVHESSSGSGRVLVDDGSRPVISYEDFLEYLQRKPVVYAAAAAAAAGVTAEQQRPPHLQEPEGGGGPVATPAADARSRRAHRVCLPFVGKNCVIFSDGPDQ
jgi:hypothetical protein